VAVATAGLSIAGSALIPWFSVKKKKDKTGGEAAESGAEKAGPSGSL